MSTTGQDAAADRYEVRRWDRGSKVGFPLLVALVVGLFAVPSVFVSGTVQQLTSLLILVIMAVTWNALAGFGGMVSVGQQAFIGFGAYATIWLTQRSVPVFSAIVLAMLLSGVLSLVVAALVHRLEGGQFAVGTWVVAEALALIVVLNSDLGGGTGISLQGMAEYDPAVRRAYVYWLTLGVLVVLLIVLFLILRSRTGTALQAIRDDPVAAASLGVRVAPLKLALFVFAGIGCGAAGALTLANTLFIQPQSIFSVQFSAYMIFMVLVGGLGSFEGPIIGAVVFFVVQQQFADQGAWYLIGLGVVAILFALFLPRGLWNALADRTHLRLLPIGYRLRPLVASRSAKET
jgi:branched-chain amino acid transport system permease protein